MFIFDYSEGLKLENVFISTRQVENCSIFEKFGIEIEFDNEKVEVGLFRLLRIVISFL